MNDESIYREIIAENIELKSLITEQSADKEQYLEYFEIMVDLVCHNDKPLIIQGRTYSSNMIKDRMLKLKREHLEHVCDIYNNYSGQITNFYRHCAATLYNSYFEVNNALVTHYNSFMLKDCV